jgi:transposase InsO family protein
VKFIDDFSRKSSIFFMNTKDEVFGQFPKFRAQVKNHKGKNIKVLRFDNGGEYTSNDFRYFFKEARIKRDLIVSYNPQENGVVEINNCSIIDSTRAMIDDHELCMILWEEECNATMYVKNKTPHRILGNKTLKEALLAVKPKIGHLRIFGCLVYIHVPMEKRKKLEPL